MTGPLAGIRVLDLTTVLLGPYAAQILGDMGADVIKVEAPGGDPTRVLGPARHPGMGAVFLNINRNKRSLALDLKQAPAREALLRLAGTADVFLHAMRPRAIARLGLAYGDLAAARPDIVYCGTYGFRAAGPYGDKPAYDDMIQAAAGLASLQEKVSGTPSYAPTAVADKITGLHVAYAVSMALFHRERTGQGQEIEVPMFESVVSFTLPEHIYGETFDPPIGDMGYPRQLSPDRRPYRTSDGWIGVLPFTDRQWSAFFEVAGRDDLAADARYASLEARTANIDALYADLSAIVATRTTAEWMGKLDSANVPAMPVNAPEDLPGDPHLSATGFWRWLDHPSEGRLRAMDLPVHFSASPGDIRLPAPRLGEHSAEILRDAGLADREIAAMMKTGAAVEPAD
ncbi:MAG: CaiB/BaiF CoA transferase family protein [Alphaproteobacteria bacterium]